MLPSNNTGEGEAAPIGSKVVYSSRKEQQPKKQLSSAAAVGAEADAQQQTETEEAVQARYRYPNLMCCVLP